MGAERRLEVTKRDGAVAQLKATSVEMVLSEVGNEAAGSAIRYRTRSGGITLIWVVERHEEVDRRISVAMGALH